MSPTASATEPQQTQSPSRVANDFSIRRESLFGATELQWRSIREYRYRILMTNAGGHFGGIAYLIAHMIARRLSSVMKHTINARGEVRLDPDLTVATALPSDSTQSILARLTEARRAAS